MTTAREHEPTAADAAAKKAFRHLLPFLVLLYVLAYIDRINIGFAALSMNQDLGLTAAMFGFANTAFYITYSLFEVPSNVMLAKYGARIWLPRIMITWGLASVATMFVVGPNSLYAVRALVGLAEAGALPGILYYLGRWFPADYRARANAVFLTALPIAIMVGSPLSGLILQMDGVLGIAGWRWLLLLEGLPAVFLGIAAYFVLTERPADARWLTGPEKESLQARLDLERAAQPQNAHSYAWRDVLGAIGSKQVIGLGLVYFCMVATVNTLGIWSPLIVRELLDNTDNVILIGFVGSIPPVFAIIGMLYFSARSDRTGERYLHCALLMGLAIVGWTLVVIGGSAVMKMVGLIVCYAGAFSAFGIFWAAASEVLSHAARAASIAAISTIGTFASILSPSIVGVLRDLTGTMAAGIWYSAALLLLGTCALLVVKMARHGARHG